MDVVKNCLSATDVANVLGVSKPTVYQIIARSDFPKVHVGRKIIVPADAFKDWLTERTGENLL